MTARQQFAADFAEGHESAAGEIGEIDGPFMVIELPHQELTGTDVGPAEKGVRLHLHCALTVDYALAILRGRMRLQEGRASRRTQLLL